MGRWKAAEHELARPDFDWSTFRQNRRLMKGIQTGHARLDMWMSYCRRDSVPRFAMVDSNFGTPTGRFVDGKLYTAGSCKNAWYAHDAVRRAAKLSAPALSRSRLHLLEIGGGYGGMARALCSMLPIETVSFIDAEPLVTVQRVYVRETTRARVVEHDAERRYDVVTNTMSFGEMPYAAVKTYFDVIKAQLTEGGFFYTANRVSRETDFAAYPYGKHWRHSVNFMPNEQKEKLARGYVSCCSVRDHRADSPHPVTMLS